MKRYAIAFVVGALAGAAFTDSWLVGAATGVAAVPTLIALDAVNAALERWYENDRDRNREDNR